MVVLLSLTHTFEEGGELAKFLVALLTIVGMLCVDI